jgi:hypothetical protein
MQRDATTDSIESVLDRISIMREELLAIEKSLERILATNRVPVETEEETNS